MAYCSIDDVKLYLTITADDDDALLQSLVDAAQKLIDTYCKRTFEATADTTRTFDAKYDIDDEGLMLWLDHDLVAITSVTNGDGTTVTGSQYVTEPRNHRPIYGLKLKEGGDVVWTYSTTPENAISIVGRWAYSTAAPADVKQACIRLAAFLYRQKDNSGDVTTEVIQTGMGTAIAPSSMPRDVRYALNPYIRQSP